MAGAFLRNALPLEAAPGGRLAWPGGGHGVGEDGRRRACPPCRERHAEGRLAASGLGSGACRSGLTPSAAARRGADLRSSSVGRRRCPSAVVASSAEAGAWERLLHAECRAREGDGRSPHSPSSFGTLVQACAHGCGGPQQRGPAAPNPQALSELLGRGCLLPSHRLKLTSASERGSGCGACVGGHGAHVVNILPEGQ